MVSNADVMNVCVVSDTLRDERPASLVHDLSGRDERTSTAQVIDRVSPAELTPVEPTPVELTSIEPLPVELTSVEPIPVEPSPKSTSVESTSVEPSSKSAPVQLSSKSAPVQPSVAPPAGEDTRSASDIPDELSLRTASDARSAALSAARTPRLASAPAEMSDEASRPSRASQASRSADESLTTPRSEAGGSYSEDFSGGSTASSRRGDSRTTTAEEESVDTEEDISERLSLDAQDDSGDDDSADDVRLRITDVGVPVADVTGDVCATAVTAGADVPAVMMSGGEAPMEVTLAPDEVVWVSEDPAAAARLTDATAPRDERDDESDSVTESVVTATDSELERVISSAAAAVEQFDEPTADVTAGSDGADKCEGVAKDLLNEAISDMLQIRQQKDVEGQHTGEEGEKEGEEEQEKEEERKEEGEERKSAVSSLVPLQPPAPVNRGITKAVGGQSRIHVSFSVRFSVQFSFARL